VSWIFSAHLQRKSAASFCDPPCSEKQAGIGPISQMPELVTMTRSYDEAVDRASFHPPGRARPIFARQLFSIF
jgi:hypothetical protein